ncbi:MAG: DGQHR domain-containing protein [Terriglobales bacterium]
MLGTRLRQKDSHFYFVAFPADELLRHVRFQRRYYGDDGDEPVAPAGATADSEIAGFIASIERKDKAFQREISARKVKAIKAFFENAQEQPPIPGAVLLFSAEKLAFKPLPQLPGVGDIQLPREPFLIIDGQHRLAALRFYLKERRGEAAELRVPCMLFDGSSADFAAEMFVTINSNATNIRKSHLVDLYERVSWAAADKKMAARIAQMLYEESDSPLRYKIDRLGGRSRQGKWILQAELFNELHRWNRDPDTDYDRAYVTGAYAAARDILACARELWPAGWPDPQRKYMITRPVVLKALLRVAADLIADEGDEAALEGRQKRWLRRLEPWRALEREFRDDGEFYTRFAAKGQLERVAVIHKRLAQAAGVKLRPQRRAAAAE